LTVPPFIVTTGAGDEYVAVELMRRGAINYLIKDHEFLKVLPTAVERALVEVKLKQRLVEAEKKLRLAAQVIEATNEGVFVTDSTLRMIDVNPACERILGYGRDELIGRLPQTLLPGHADEQEQVEAIFATLKTLGQWQGELSMRRKNGEVFTGWFNIGRIKAEDGSEPLYVTLFSDISNVKAMAEHLDYLAHHDPLTRLPNRLLFSARLRHCIERAQRAKGGVGLLFLDLDHFKEVNDRLGHAAGDDLLCLLAQRMATVLREEDTLARLGGDEFVVLIEDARSLGDLQRVVDQVLALFPQPVATPEGIINVTASIGGALYPADAGTAAGLVECADKAMYVAKQAGRNTFRQYAA
jgi:diguanylate cyclase (GGDEF)-like protein/PAS domain S-box-containing protein